MCVNPPTEAAITEDVLNAAEEAYADTYEAEYFVYGSRDNKRAALRAALKAALAEWRRNR